MFIHTQQPWDTSCTLSAPDGINSGISMDVCCTGIILYEFLTGFPPFNDDTPELIFDHITNLDPAFPEDMPPSAQDLVHALLQKDPSVRLGSGPEKARAIKCHAFFEEISWEVLPMRLMPFVDWGTPYFAGT